MKRAGFTLVVDDDEAVRASLWALLESNGHSVCVAKDVQEAMHQLEYQTPEFLICDYMLDDETSSRLTRTEAFSRIPTRILLTGHARSELELDVVSRFTDVFSKPCSSRELLNVLARRGI